MAFLESLIVTDCDKVFISVFWWELLGLQGTSLSSPQRITWKSSQTEVMNRSIGAYLQCFASDQPKSTGTLFSTLLNTSTTQVVIKECDIDFKFIST